MRGRPRYVFRRPYRYPPRRWFYYGVAGAAPEAAFHPTLALTGVGY